MTQRTTWTPEDDTRLLELMAQGLSQLEIGNAMGRTDTSVKMRVHLLRGIGVLSAGKPRQASAATPPPEPRKPLPAVLPQVLPGSIITPLSKAKLMAGR